METEEQMARRLELTRIMTEEMYRDRIKVIKRAANKAPAVSDRIKPISLALKK